MSAAWSGGQRSTTRHASVAGIHAALPAYLRMTIGSGLVLGMTAVLLLNAIFRIGMSRTAE